MTSYIVHLYREMRLSYTGIEADTPQAAAEIARDRPTGDAANIEDCDGESLAALVDVAGEEEFEHSRSIDFETERQHKAAPKLLAALQAVLTYAESEAESLFECWKRDGDLQIKDAADRCQRAMENARAAIAESTAAGITCASCNIDIPTVLAGRRQIAAIWSIEDVRGIRPDLTKDQCWDVLENVQRTHDAEYGICWTTLAVWADELFGRAPQTDKTREAEPWMPSKPKPSSRTARRSASLSMPIPTLLTR